MPVPLYRRQMGTFFTPTLHVYYNKYTGVTVYTRILQYTHAYYSIHMRITEYTCTLQYTHAYYSINMHITVYTCILQYTHAYYSIHVHITVYTCILQYTRAYYSIHVHITVYTCILQLHTCYVTHTTPHLHSHLLHNVQTVKEGFLSGDYSSHHQLTNDQLLSLNHHCTPPHWVDTGGVELGGWVGEAEGREGGEEGGEEGGREGWEGEGNEGRDEAMTLQ